MRNRNRVDRAAGFTLIELMVVIVILGLLVGIVAPNFIGIVEDAKVDTTKASMKQIADAVKIYKLRKGKLPGSLSEMVPDPLPETPLDGWKNEFHYSPVDRTKFELKSYGADGQEGGDGHDADITLEDLNKRAEDGQ